MLSRQNSRLPIALALLAGGFLLTANAQEVLYKWTDEHGTTHYAALPPTDRDYMVVDMAAGRLSIVEAPRYEVPDDEDENEDEIGNGQPESAPQRAARVDPRTLDPVSRADYCDELGTRLRWLLAGRSDMLEGVYPAEQVRNVESRGDLIEEVSTEIDDNC